MEAVSWERAGIEKGPGAASVPGASTRSVTDARLDRLVACPECDVLHELVDVPPGVVARCVRCHVVLMKPRRNAMTQIVMLALASAVLIVAAMFFPFLGLESRGLQEQVSVVDAILAYTADEATIPLTFALAALIFILPLFRLCAIIYALAPMAIGWAPAPGAERAFRWAELVRPWAMGEVFIVGVAVALVKIGGIAQLTLGEAFWAFTALVLLMVLNDTFMCRLTVWQTLEARRRSR
jgi:paraquat-inducible protein A